MRAFEGANLELRGLVILVGVDREIELMLLCFGKLVIGIAFGRKFFGVPFFSRDDVVLGGGRIGRVRLHVVGEVNEERGECVRISSSIQL